MSLQTDLARELALAADVESTGGATVNRFSESSISGGERIPVTRI